MVEEVRRAVDDSCRASDVEPVMIGENQMPLSRPELPGSVVLRVGEKAAAASADYLLGFVDRPDGSAKPVLYFRGKRVIASWSLQISHQEPADPWGCSG